MYEFDIFTAGNINDQYKVFARAIRKVKIVYKMN